MSESSKQFSAYLRGETSEPTLAGPKSRAEAFNALLRTYGTAQYEDALDEYEEAERREQQGKS